MESQLENWTIYEHFISVRMNITILTPDKDIFEGPIKSVNVPGIGGQFEILSNHAPIVSALGEGNIRLIKEDNEKMSFQINKGFVEVLNNEVSLLVEGVTFP